MRSHFLRHLPRLAPLLLALLSLGLLSRPASAATLGVPSQYATIQAAVNAAQNGDTVLIADGTYTGPGNVDIDFGGKNIAVTSQNGAATTIIDCGGSANANHRGFYLHSGETNAVISGLTIQSGFVSGNGPGGNYSSSGGGILNFNVSMTIQNCILQNNTASYGNGGGICNFGIVGDTIAMVNCAVVGNSATYNGGGISNDGEGGTSTVTSCTITGNAITSAYGRFAGIFNSGYPNRPGSSTLTLTNDIVYGDTGGEIGGGTATASNCDIQGGYTGTGNINADPLFVSIPTDLHLQSGSPCLGAGTPAGAPARTLDGRTRPNPPGIGAYEGTVTSATTATTTTLISSLNPSVVGQSVAFTATVTAAKGVPTGTVVFTVDGIAQAHMTLSNGKASYSTSALTSGSHVIRAAYSGDTNFISSTSPALTQTVNTAATTTALTSSLNPAPYGQSITFTATVTGNNPTGTVTFTDVTNAAVIGTGTVSAGSATLAIGLTGGTHQIVASYGGDANNSASTSPALTQTVTQSSTTTTLTSSLNPSIFGQSVTFRTTITGTAGPAAGNPTGAYVYTIDGVALPPLTVNHTYTTSALSVGTHTVTVSYSGDASYIASASAPLTQTVIAHVSPQYVSPSGSDNNSGTQSAPKLTIQAAINATLSGDTVIIEDGTYTGPGNVDLEFGRRSITITSQNGAAGTVIDCGGYPGGSANHRAFSVYSSVTSAVIRGLTIQNGYEDSSQPYGGGAIYNESAGLTIQSCVIRNNSAAQGGGIYNNLYSTGTATITNCLLIGNSTNGSALYGGGGGIYNYSYNAGGPGNWGGTIQMTGCTITGNTALFGGGVYNFSGVRITVGGCIISGNTAQAGGGIYNVNVGTGTGIVVNCVIANNTATAANGNGNGGGIYNSATGFTLTNCTLISNTAPAGGGGGIYVDNYTGASPTTTLTNDIFYGDTGGEISGATVTVNFCDIQGGYQIPGYYPSGIINADPLFASPSSDLHLSAGSPCIGAGTASGAPATTIDGYTRPNPPSIGAYETEQTGTTTALASSLNPSTAGQSVTFTATVTSGTPTGTVTFTVDGTAQAPVTLSAGQAVFSTSGLSVGSHTLTAAYSGDQFNTASTSGALTQTVNVLPATPTYQIDAGGGASTPFSADMDFSGGSTYATSAPISTAGTTSPAPQAVYQSERFGNFTYTLNSLTPGASYTLRLHFAEIYWTSVGQRVFSVAVNGIQALTNFDIVAAAGGANKAVVETIPVTADPTGKVTVTFTTVKDNAKLSGLELLPAGTPVVPPAPTGLAAVPGNTQVTLSWTGSPAAASYSVYRSTSSGTETLLQSGLTTPTYTDTGLTNGTTYFYQVAAVNSAGTSAKSGEVSTTPAVTASTPVYQINAGGGQAGTFSADRNVSTGGTYVVSAPISTAGVTNPAPQSVYQSERFGNFTYTLDSLTPGASYTLRLHFAEIYWTAAGQRVFSVAVNGTTVLPNFDIFAAVGANTAVVKTFPVAADKTGTLTVTFTSVKDNAKLSGLELLQ